MTESNRAITVADVLKQLELWGLDPERTTLAVSHVSADTLDRREDEVTDIAANIRLDGPSQIILRVAG